MNASPKILFAIRSTNHFTYYQSIIESLAKKGAVVQVLFCKKWSDENEYRTIYKNSSDSKHLKFGWSINRSGIFRKPLFLLREIRTYRHYLLLKKQSKYYAERWRKYLPLPLSITFKSPYIQKILKSRTLSIFLESLENLTPPDKKIIELVEKYSPDVIVAGPANLRFSEEIEYIKAAKKMSIPSSIPVISWDNLTTKGLMQIKPDQLIVWNNTHKEEAIRYHNIDSKKIEVVGSYFFDKWFSALKPSISREGFCKQIGLDKNYPIITYLGSSANIAQDETWLINDIYKLLKNSSSKLINTQIIIRPHPANVKIYEKIEKMGLTIYPKEGSLSTSKQQLQQFFNTLYYSFAVLGINTSAMIDAVICNKPIIALMNKKYNQTQKDAKHFQHLIKSDVLNTVTTNEQLLGVLNKLLKGEDNHIEQRDRFVKSFVRPQGMSKSAGLAAAEKILSIIN